MKVISFVVFLLFSFSLAFTQNEIKNVAVLDFQALGISDFEAIALSERFRVELFNSNQYVVLERGKMDEILKEQGFQNFGCTTNECLVEMGKLINVNYMFGGSISKFGNVFTVMIKLIDVETAEIIQSQAIDLAIKKEKLMTEGMKSVAGVFAGKEMAEFSFDNDVPKEIDRLSFEPEMVFIKGGNFMMGDVFGEGEDNEKPVHEVFLNDFFIGKYEITFDQYLEYCEESGTEVPDDEGWGYGNQPVINVSWNDAMNYCKWLSKKSEKIYTLPTEEQWEFVARSGGKKHRYSGTSLNDRLNIYAWFDDNSDDRPHSIGEKNSNDLGVYDMTGNVMEFCSDFYYEYKEEPTLNRIESKKGYDRVLRGGSFKCKSFESRNFFRNYLKRTYGINKIKIKSNSKSEDFGFRVIKSIKEE